MPPITSQVTEPLAQKIKGLLGETGAPLGDKIRSFFQPSAQGVRFRDVVREAVPQLGQVAQEFTKFPVSAAMIPADLVSNIVTGKPLPPLSVPGLGEAKSYSRRALDYQKEPGYTPLTAGVRAASEGILDVASLGQVFQSAGIGTQNVRDLLKSKPPAGTVEQVIESQGGWKPGTKVQFDTALGKKDAATIQKLLPDVPKEYQTRFANEIRSAQLEGLTKSPEAIKLYRGQNPSNVGGQHFTTDPAWAKNFGDETLTGSLPKGSKVVTVSKDLVDDATSRGAKTEAEVYDDLFRQGYDAVVGTDPMNAEAIDVIVNPKHLASFTSAETAPSLLGKAAEALTKSMKSSIDEPTIGLAMRRIPESEFEGIRKLRSEGLTYQEIADKFGVTRQRIEQIAKGVPKHEPLEPYYKPVVTDGKTHVASGVPKEEYAAVQDLYKQGYSYEEIGKRYGVTRQNVQQILDRATQKADESFKGLSGWSELQKQNPDLFNTGILRRSLKPVGAKDAIPEDVHNAQAKWQNYGQGEEIPANVVYERVSKGPFKGDYLDEQGNTVRNADDSLLKDTYNESTQEWEVPTVSNKVLKENLLNTFSTVEGKNYLSKVIEALPKNPDGTITAYRIGAIGEGPQSYTLSEGMAKTFSHQGTDIPLPGTPGLPKGGYEDFGVLPVNVVKIDPKGIKAWSPYDAEILVEPKFVKTNSHKSLVTVHNLTEQKLKFADRIGGLPNPSMAVIDPRKNAFESFGDITLVADKNILRGQSTRLADAYTPRFPSVHTSMDYKDFDALQASLKPYYDKIGADARLLYRDDTEMLRNIENNSAVALKFLESKGVKPSAEGQHYYHSQITEDPILAAEFQDYLDGIYKQYNLQEQMFAGYTPSGQRRYKPVTLEGASKIMGKQKEEGFNYGLGSFRSKIAPVKKTPEAIKKEQGRLVTKEQFEVIKEQHDNELFALRDELEPFAKITDSSNRFIESDHQINAIGGVLSGERDAMRWFDSKFPNAPQELKDKVIAFREKLKHMPTEYFETKFKRPVTLDEFRIAVVPDTTSEATIKLLESKGLQIIKYAKGEKQKVMDSLLLHPEAFGIGVAPSFLPQDETKTSTPKQVVK